MLQYLDTSQVLNVLDDSHLGQQPSSSLHQPAPPARQGTEESDSSQLLSAELSNKQQENKGAEQAAPAEPTAKVKHSERQSKRQQASAVNEAETCVNGSALNPLQPTSQTKMEKLKM
eukprot:jgi/Chrzof1/11590/Cz06g01100.t1